MYPSYFKPQVCWLSSLTPVTYLCKLLGIHCVAACLQLELFRVSWFERKKSVNVEFTLFFYA
ncbi:hypothetical protein D5071_08730 [Pectobacterium carotovorum]|uniref:Uncharacterized protein n=1 Tax=Pectobacterium carotovorum TaxID=554 RepID=A0A419AXJ0_PECCA|nr:hypothetical protein D5071_08730 [Pectobacterium carotovorum]